MLTENKNIDDFLSNYDEQVVSHTLQLRVALLTLLPNIIEQIDLPAKMIAYCYGQKYTDMICVIIPSKKGLKLGFSRGVELADPNNLLEGTGKISRYVPIISEKQITSTSLKKLIKSAYNLYEKKYKQSI